MNKHHEELAEHRRCMDEAYNQALSDVMDLLTPHMDKWRGENTCAVLNDIDDEIEVLQKEILNATMKNKVNNNKYDHKIVTESELTDYLNQGWEIVKDLPKGRLVIKSPLPQGVG